MISRRKRWMVHDRNEKCILHVLKTLKGRDHLGKRGEDGG
jgi:hypothetical protein